MEEEMDQRHATELAALEQRERDAAGPQQDTVSILNTDLYSFNLSAEETQKNVRLDQHKQQHMPQLVASSHIQMHCSMSE